MKLRQYLLRSQILIVALPICILSVIVFHSFDRSMKDEIYRKNVMIARAMSAHVSEMLEDSVRQLEQIRALYYGGGGDPENFNALATRIMGRDSFFESILIVDSAGIARRSIPVNPELLGTDQSRQEYFRAVKLGDKQYWSNSFISVASGRPTVILAIPMGHDVLVGYLNLERISSLSEAFKDSFGKDTYITITDGRGVFISHFEKERVSQRETAENFAVMHQSAHDQGGVFDMAIGGRDYLVNFEEIDSPEWHVIVYQSYTAAFGIMRQMEVFFGLAAILVFFAAVMLSRQQIETALRAFSILNRRFAEIAGGVFSGQVEVGKFAELNELAGHFNQMVVSIRERDERLRQLAYSDPLTGLPNREFFHKYLSELIRDSGQEAVLAIVFMDLDSFKVINDTHGHWRGDEVLKAVADRLRSLLPDGALLARLGGDEFVFVVKDWENKQGEEWIESMRDLMTYPVEVDGYSYHTGASFGVAVYPTDSRDEDELIRFADMAMYQVKAQGKNGYCFYSAGIRSVLERKADVEKALRSALADEEFSLHYQPLVTVDGKKLRGFEALLRWNSRSLGSVSPLEFIPIAEENGMINRIGFWVMQTASAKLAQLISASGQELIMSVNLSALQLKDPGFVLDVADVVFECGIKPSQLEFEITESALIGSMDNAVAVLRRIKSLGVRVSLDDFGTGYSSLSYLHQLPIDTIKIDKSFFRDVTENQRGQDMLAGIVYLSRKLGVNIVAEGIETEEQMRFVADIECDFVQGYLIRRPMPEKDVEDYLKESV